MVLCHSGLTAAQESGMSASEDGSMTVDVCPYIEQLYWDTLTLDEWDQMSLDEYDQMLLCPAAPPSGDEFGTVMMDRHLSRHINRTIFSRHGADSIENLPRPSRAGPELRRSL